MRGKVSQVVKIYQDPLSKNKLEGEAILKRFVSENEAHIEDWEVEFVGEPGETYYRIIDMS